MQNIFGGSAICMVQIGVHEQALGWLPPMGIKNQQQKSLLYISPTLILITKPWCARSSAVFIIHIISSTSRICKIFKSVWLLD
jgi:hypothetical protein